MILQITLVGFLFINAAFSWRSLKEALYARDVVDYNDWKIWPNASKIYSEETCSSELANYEDIPPIVTQPVTVYDVKQLNTFKTIGNSFLNMITSESLFDTVSLAMQLSPLDSMDKIFLIVDYQLTLFILIFLGVFTATLILILYIIFWTLKLTGNISEVKSQSIADSKGPVRFILTFLLCILTIFVMFGCMIALVANTHISNNVNEASSHIQWAVNVTQTFTSQIEKQMSALFMTNYKTIQLGLLRTRLNEAITNASAVVYLELAQNISEAYNRSLMLAYSIHDVQKSNFVSLQSNQQASTTTLFPYLLEIYAAKTCVNTINKWCTAVENTGKCQSKREIPESYLLSVDPTKFYLDEVREGTADILEITEHGALAANARDGYLNGNNLHNGTLERTDISFYNNAPSYTGTCHKTDKTTGTLLRTQTPTTPDPTPSTGDPVNSLPQTVTCSEMEGWCRLEGTSTVLWWGECCVSVVYELEQGDPTTDNTDYTKCGPGTLLDAEDVPLPGSQSLYRGNISTSITGSPCSTWASIPALAGGSWDVWAASQGYTGLYYQDDVQDTAFQHNFCRNPSPKVGMYGTATEGDVRSRAWCWIGLGVNDWEYCNVPFCSGDTKTALALAAANPTTAFHYKTCEEYEKEIYGAEAPDPAADARKEAYLALDTAVSEMNAQYLEIQARFNETSRVFDELQDRILETLATESEVNEFDKYRNVGTIVSVSLCMFTACLAVAGVCMGYCNLTDVPPHRRTTVCSIGGRCIKISSYWAGLMAIVNLYTATFFFVPGALFSLICMDYQQDDLFKLFDDKVIVDHSILGRAVFGNDSHDMTLKHLLLSCRDNKTMWSALGLDMEPGYDLMSMMQLSQSLNINYTFEQLQNAVNFDPFPVYPDELKKWMELWNTSMGTQLPWANMKSNFENSFLGLDYSSLDPNNPDRLKIDNRDFCRAFYYYGNQVTERSGDVYNCKVLFKTRLKNQCDKWVEDYTDMNDIITTLRGYVDTLEEQQSSYGATFIDELITKYEYTNNNLLNKGGSTFSKDLTRKTYEYWQGVLNNEVKCFSWDVNYTVTHKLTDCHPLSDMLDGTMGYFCDYIITSITLVWISQGLLGLCMTLHMLVANRLATYFIKLQKRCPSDVSKKEAITGFQKL